MPDNKIVSATIPADKLMNPDSISLKGIVGDRIRDKEREEAEKAAQEKLKDILPELNKVHQMILDEDETDNILNTLFDISVPESGIAPTVGGEIVRAAIQILNRYYNDGDVFFKGYGLETCGGSAQYIIDNLPSVKRRMMGIVEEDFDDMDYEDAIDSAVRFIADELVENPKLFITPNAVDSRNYDASELIENQPRYELSISYSDIIDDLRDKEIIGDEDIESYITDIINDQCHSSRDDAEVYADNYGITISELTSDDYFYLDNMNNIWGGLESEYEDRLEEEDDEDDEDIDKSLNESKDDTSYIVYDSDDEVITDFDTRKDALKYAHDHSNVKALRKITWEVDDGEYYVADVEDIPLTDAIKESEELTEDTINVSPTFIEKRDALAEYLGEEGEIRYMDNDLFVLPMGGSYLVYTDEEADKAAKDYVSELIDDMGISAFSPEFQNEILTNGSEYVDEDWFEDGQKEYYETYVQDIESEYGKYANRLIDELVEEGILSEDDLDENGKPNSDIDMDEKKEEYVDHLCNQSGYDSAVDWYIDMVGTDDFSQVAKEHGLFDYDAIAEEVIRLDGRGHLLAPWDGDELELSNDFYAYKQSNNEDYDNAHSIVAESLNEDTKDGAKTKTFKRDGITYKVTKLEDTLEDGGYVARWEDDSDNGLGYNNRGFINFDKDGFKMFNDRNAPIKEYIGVISSYDRQPGKPIKDLLINTTLQLYGKDRSYLETKKTSFFSAEKSVNEDTVKRNGKWVNVGKDGKADSGKFRTKKEADAQRKAMYAQGYKGESLNDKQKEESFDNALTEGTYIDNDGSWYVDGEDNKYYAYKLTNAMTGDIFLIYSTDDKVLMRNVDKIINDITTSDDEDIVGKYDDIGVYIVSNYAGFGFGTYDTDEETGEVLINNSPITLIGKESIRF